MCCWTDSTIRATWSLIHNKAMFQKTDLEEQNMNMSTTHTIQRYLSKTLSSLNLIR